MNFKQTLAGIVLTAGLVSGCMKIPIAGDFPKNESLVAIPSHPAIMAIWGGVNKHKRLTLGGNLAGIEVQKKHWTGIESEPRRFYAPQGSTGVGILDSSGFLRHNYWIGYDKDINGDGKADRGIDQYSIDWNGNDPKLEATYLRIGEPEKNKYVNLKDCTVPK